MKQKQKKTFYMFNNFFFQQCTCQLSYQRMCFCQHSEQVLTWSQYIKLNVSLIRLNKKTIRKIFAASIVITWYTESKRSKPSIQKLVKDSEKVSFTGLSYQQYFLLFIFHLYITTMQFSRNTDYKIFCRSQHYRRLLTHIRANVLQQQVQNGGFADPMFGLRIGDSPISVYPHEVRFERVTTQTFQPVVCMALCILFVQPLKQLGLDVSRIEALLSELCEPSSGVEEATLVTSHVDAHVNAFPMRLQAQFLGISSFVSFSSNMTFQVSLYFLILCLFKFSAFYFLCIFHNQLII